MVKRTVLKVDISCNKCKKKLLQAVSSLEDRGRPGQRYVILQARKAASGKYTHVVSIGPPPKPEAPKKPEPRVQYLAHGHSPYGCALCQQMAYSHATPSWEEPNQSCSIM